MIPMAFIAGLVIGCLLGYYFTKDELVKSVLWEAEWRDWERRRADRAESHLKELADKLKEKA